MPSQPDSSVPNLSAVHWVVFDAVGTVIRPVPSVADAYHQIGVKYGTLLSREEVDRRFRQVFRETETRDQIGPNGETTSEALERERWREIVTFALPDVRDQEGCFQELYDHFARPASWCCFDDVGETLRVLTARGYQIGIASNFDERLHQVCDGLEPLRDITCRVISASVGFRKPSAGFYRAMFDLIASPPGNVLMVGDDWENDVVGARAAGAHALFLDRKGVSGESGALRSLSELAEHLPGVTAT